MAAPRRARKQSIQNLDRLMAKLNALPPTVENAMLQELGRAAVEIRNDARRRVPVLSGRLRDSIWVRKRGKRFRIGTSNIYSAAIEFGTRHSPAQPFLFPSFEQAKKGLRSRMITATFKAATKAGR